MPSYSAELLPALAPDYRESIPALHDAARERNERGQLDRLNLDKGNKEQYLESIVREIGLRLCAIKENIFEIGHLLTEIKSLLYGKFQKWGEENLPFSMKTAQNYMNVYRQCLGMPELVSLFKPSILYHVCSHRCPERFRQELFSNARGAYDFSLKEFMKVLVRYTNGEIDIESAEVQDLLKSQKNHKTNQTCISELKKVKRELEGRLNNIKKLNESSSVNPLITEEGNLEEEKYEEIEDMLEGFVSKIESKIYMLEQET